MMDTKRTRPLGAVRHRCPTCRAVIASVNLDVKPVSIVREADHTCSTWRLHVAARRQLFTALSGLMRRAQ